MGTISGNPINGFKIDEDEIEYKNCIWHLPPIVEVCIWRLTEDQWGSYWQPGCKDDGVDGTMADDEDGPMQWDWRFCPFCGTQMIQRRSQDV